MPEKEGLPKKLPVLSGVRRLHLDSFVPMALRLALCLLVDGAAALALSGAGHAMSLRPALPVRASTVMVLEPDSMVAALEPASALWQSSMTLADSSAAAMVDSLSPGAVVVLLSAFVASVALLLAAVRFTIVTVIPYILQLGVFVAALELFGGIIPPI
jgi:hypothetical protein